MLGMVVRPVPLSLTARRALLGDRARCAGRLSVTGFAAAILVLALFAPARAQDDGWSIIFTPQVWFSHITNNGFAAPPPPILPGGFGPNPHQFTVTSQPANALDPQWGAQLALQKNRWTFGVAAQYVSFETRNDISTNGAVTQAAIFGVTLPFPLNNINTVPGQQIVQERVDSDRFDFDLALTYFLPDVAKDVLDVNAGLGFKFIYASATRQFFNGIDPQAGVSLGEQYLYAQCSNDDLLNCRTVQKVPVDDFYYGATFPLSFSFYPTADKKWIIPFNVSPFLGAETRDDHNVVYAVQSGGPTGFTAKRLDGTTFAYGATADVGLRYVFDNGVALYGGFRVQFIEGHEQYLAWGPLLNMSVRFGK
jgi:hypothetical protein